MVKSQGFTDCVFFKHSKSVCSRCRALTEPLCQIKGRCGFYKPCTTGSKRAALTEMYKCCGAISLYWKDYCFEIIRYLKKEKSSKDLAADCGLNELQFKAMLRECVKEIGLYRKGLRTAAAVCGKSVLTVDDLQLLSSLIGD